MSAMMRQSTVVRKTSASWSRSTPTIQRIGYLNIYMVLKYLCLEVFTWWFYLLSSISIFMQIYIYLILWKVNDASSDLLKICLKGWPCSTNTIIITIFRCCIYDRQVKATPRTYGSTDVTIPAKGRSHSSTGRPFTIPLTSGLPVSRTKMLAHDWVLTAFGGTEIVA